MGKNSPKWLKWSRFRDPGTKMRWNQNQISYYFDILGRSSLIETFHHVIMYHLSCDEYHRSQDAYHLSRDSYHLSRDDMNTWQASMWRDAVLQPRELEPEIEHEWDYGKPAIVKDHRNWPNGSVAIKHSTRLEDVKWPMVGRVRHIYYTGRPATD